MRCLLTNLLLVLFLVSSVGGEELGNSKVYIGKLPEKGNYFFKVDEIPANLTVYWDFNMDGFPDAVFGCPVVGGGRVYDCGERIKNGEDEYVFSTCPSRAEDYDRGLKYFYYLTKNECWECLSCRAWITKDTKYYPKAVGDRIKCNLNN
jgi:hypothetical protein